MAKRILVVDDEASLLFMVTYALKKRGYEVFSGRDGREALDLAPRLIPDLMILDVQLPIVNGDEAARIFKADEKLKHIPVILMSSGIAGLSEKAAACGADAYLNKPFKFEELNKLVTKYFAPG